MLESVKRGREARVKGRYRKGIPGKKGGAELSTLGDGKGGGRQERKSIFRPERSTWIRPECIVNELHLNG